jgi:hypothetical protein
MVGPLVWLGQNSNFCPDPMHWEPRELYHSDQKHKDQYPKETADDLEYLVWGEECDDEDEQVLEMKADDDNELSCTDEAHP